MKVKTQFVMMMFFVMGAFTLLIAQQKTPVPFKELTVRPQLLKQVAPLYPEKARKNGWEGMTVLKIIVDQKGKVSDVTVLKSSGHRVLDRAAIAAARQFVFAPGQKDGKTVRVEMTLPISFKLKK